MNDKNNKNVPRRERSVLLLTVLFRPRAVFEDLALSEPSPYRVFFKFLIWFAVLPPLFAYIGGLRNGWDLGAANPLVLNESELQVVSLLYFLVLLVAFVSTAFVSQWMSETYGARHSLGVHMALVAILAARRPRLPRGHCPGCTHLPRPPHPDSPLSRSSVCAAPLCLLDHVS